MAPHVDFRDEVFHAVHLSERRVVFKGRWEIPTGTRPPTPATIHLSQALFGHASGLWQKPPVLQDTAAACKRQGWLVDQPPPGLVFGLGVDHGVGLPVGGWSCVGRRDHCEEGLPKQRIPGRASEGS